MKLLKPLAALAITTSMVSAGQPLDDTEMFEVVWVCQAPEFFTTLHSTYTTNLQGINRPPTTQSTGTVTIPQNTVTNEAKQTITLTKTVVSTGESGAITKTITETLTIPASSNQITQSAAVSTVTSSNAPIPSSSSSSNTTLDITKFYTITEGNPNVTYDTITGLYIVSVPLYLSGNSGAKISSVSRLDNNPNAELIVTVNPQDSNAYILTYIIPVNLENSGVPAMVNRNNAFKRELFRVCLDPFNIDFNITLPDGTVTPVVVTVDNICVLIDDSLANAVSSAVSSAAVSSAAVSSVLESESSAAVSSLFESESSSVPSATVSSSVLESESSSVPSAAVSSSVLESESSSVPSAAISSSVTSSAVISSTTSASLPIISDPAISSSALESESSSALESESSSVPSAAVSSSVLESESSFVPSAAISSSVTSSAVISSTTSASLPIISDPAVSSSALESESSAAVSSPAVSSSIIELSSILPPISAPASGVVSSSDASPISFSSSAPVVASSSLDASSSSSVSAPIQSDANAIIDRHNQYRQLHQVGDLTWSDTLAEYAKNYLDSNNLCNTLAHSGGPYGENLAGGYSDLGSIDAWYNEGSLYDYSNPGFSSATGHFTQVVWKGTSEVGCYTYNCNGVGLGYIFACEYNPPGNVIGQFPENVFPIPPS